MWLRSTTWSSVQQREKCPSRGDPWRSAQLVAWTLFSSADDNSVKSRSSQRARHPVRKSEGDLQALSRNLVVHLAGASSDSRRPRNMEDNNRGVTRFEGLWNERKLAPADVILDDNCQTHQLRSGSRVLPVPRGGPAPDQSPHRRLAVRLPGSSDHNRCHRLSGLEDRLRYAIGTEFGHQRDRQ